MAITSVTIYDGVNVVGTAYPLQGGLYEFVWNGVPIGPHTLTAKAVDIMGNMATSAPATIQIQIQANLGRLIAGGLFHSVMAKRDGTVWAWGDNRQGQIGDGSWINRLSPVQVIVSPGVGLSGVATVGSGYQHSLAAKTDGTVWAWGNNCNGQLGNRTTINRNRATQVSSLSGIVRVSGGKFHSMALRSDGTVWTWGANGSGQLGDGTTTQRLTPVQVSGITDVIAIASGDLFCVALKSDGTVWTWGDNSYGQLGIGSTIGGRSSPVQVTAVSGIVGIAAGLAHAVVVKNDGTVSAWGINWYGQVGDGTTVDRRSPVLVSGVNGIIAVAASYNHTLALKSDGTCWAWGYNVWGQLGDGTIINRLSPVMISLSGSGALSAGYLHSFSLQEDGTVYSWGYNNYGQLGDGTGIIHKTPAVIPGFTY
jgi:alpha-tubulin suppressor-like RCC1 family protein